MPLNQNAVINVKQFRALCPTYVWSYGVREVVSSIPDRGNIVGWVVLYPTRWLARFSLIWKCLSFQILNLFITLSSWGSGNYRPSAPFLYEVASHDKNCHSGHYCCYYYYYYIWSECFPLKNGGAYFLYAYKIVKKAFRKLKLRNTIRPPRW